MAMAMEDSRVGAPIVMTREPEGPKRGSDKGSMGDRALMDAIFIVGIAWAILALLAITLNRHNV